MARTICALALAALVAACAHTEVRVGAGTPPAGSGGLSVGLKIQAGSTAAALIAIGILAGAAYSESWQGGTRYRANPFLALDPLAGEPAPPMDESRRVSEQDCTRPLEDPSANLRCR
jgi:hypothetical protein